MKIIEIAALSNGAHRNQNGGATVVPSGWAVIPESMVIPGTFPFVGIEVKDGVVVSMTAGTVPEVDPAEAEPTQLDILEAQVTYTAMITDTLIPGV